LTVNELTARFWRHVENYYCHSDVTCPLKTSP